jgi:predicted membrane protein
MDFSGLSVQELDVTTWAGEVDIDFASPNKIEMSHLHINTKIGETNIHHLGNARFTEAEIDGGIGEMRLDFAGAMLDGARANIDLDIGETRLYLPDDLGVRLSLSKFAFLTDVRLPASYEKSGRYYYSRHYQRSARSLQLHVSQGIGAVQFRITNPAEI